MGIAATALAILFLSANAAPKELGVQMKSLRGKNIRIIGAHVSYLFSFFYRHLILIYTLQEPPGFMFIKDPRNSTIVKHSGVSFDILNLLADSLGFT